MTQAVLRPLIFHLMALLLWAGVASSAPAGWRPGAVPTPALPARADLPRRAAEILDDARYDLFPDLADADARIDECDKVIALDPGDELAYCRRAKAWIEKGEYGNALADYDAAARLSPKSIDIYVARAGAREELGQYAQAAADYTAAITLDPSDAELYYQRAGVYEELARYDEAVADYDAAHRLDSEQTDVLLARGSLLSDLGRYDEAIADFTQILEIDPGDLDAHFQRGLALSGREDYEAAIADFSEVIRADHADGAALASRANAWAAVGKYHLALSDIEEAEPLSTDDGDARYDLGDACRTLGRYRQAVEHYRAAVRLVPDETSYTITLAMMLATAPADEARDGQEALRLAKRAVEQTEERDAHALFALAAAYAELGRFDSAAAWQERAIELVADRQEFEEVLQLYRDRRPLRDGPSAVAEETVEEPVAAEPAAVPGDNRSRLKAADDDDLPTRVTTLALAAALGLVGLAAIVVLIVLGKRHRRRRT